MIAICPNPFRDTDLAVTRRTVRLLEEAGYETLVCPLFDGGDGAAQEGLRLGKLRAAAENCSLAVIVGGDGTILAAVRQLQGITLPLLGINLGTKGFMTALEPENLPMVLKAARGEYLLSRRMMLDVELCRDGKTIYANSALNDAVIHGYGECVKITAWCNGERITGFTGDGVILSTPTGSTGYSMSAGGPIVEPDAANLILSPICAHLMGSRSFVLAPDRQICVKTEMQQGRKAYLSVDGNSNCDLLSGDMLSVKRSEHVTLMADMGLKSFYELAFEKLI